MGQQQWKLMIMRSVMEVRRIHETNSEGKIFINNWSRRYTRVQSETSWVRFWRLELALERRASRGTEKNVKKTSASSSWANCLWYMCPVTRPSLMAAFLCCHRMIPSFLRHRWGDRNVLWLWDGNPTLGNGWGGVLLQYRNLSTASLESVRYHVIWRDSIEKQMKKRG